MSAARNILPGAVAAACVLALMVAVFMTHRPATGASPFMLATFSADVTVPLHHGMMGGAWLSKRVADPLEAHGFVLLGGGKPVVF